MKLRSHEILSTNKNPIRSPNPSRFKQIFQPKNLFKKKFQQQPSVQTQHHHGLMQTIPDYVRKSLFRFLLEVKSPPSHQPTPSQPTRQVPPMGIQALKTKHPPKRSLRLKQQQQQPINDKTTTFDAYQPQQPNNYDMTILHMSFEDDNDEDSFFAAKSSTNQKKPIPQWARKNELQIAICNQIYFHRNPSEIFGNSIDCSPSHLRTVLHSMLPNVDLFDSGPRNSNKSVLI